MIKKWNSKSTRIVLTLGRGQAINQEMMYVSNLFLTLSL